MLVPLSCCHWPRRLGAAERISTPGADTSGLRRSDKGVGPARSRQLSADRRRADGDRRRRGSGRRDRSPPEGLEVVPGGDRRDDAGGGAPSMARTTRSRLGGISGSPIERLMTSMPSCTAPRSLRRSRASCRPGRRWTRSGRSGRGSCRGRPAARRRRAFSAAAEGICVPWLPAAMPATWVVLRSSGIERELGEAGPRRGGRERPGAITFAVVKAVWPFGKPGGIAYPPGRRTDAGGRCRRR